jgi:hypothetical protein
MGAIAALIWIKVFFALESTKVFGPTIKIIQIMTIDLIQFLGLWVMILTFYTCVGMLIFYEVKNF